MCMKFRTFLKKDVYPSVIISAMMNSEIGGYLNV